MFYIVKGEWRVGVNRTAVSLPNTSRVLWGVLAALRSISATLAATLLSRRCRALWGVLTALCADSRRKCYLFDRLVFAREHAQA